ncbi:MAG: hypothetical protein KDC87_09360, partial [Planctomycetes bacterium]|nr:hypothetical protein [Planctomycetota bacterium]
DVALLSAAACALVPSPIQAGCIAALGPIVSICAAAGVPMALIDAVGDFVPNAPGSLLVKVKQPSPPTGTVEFRIELPVLGMQGLCDAAQSKLEDWIARKVRSALLKRSPGLRQLMRLLSHLANKDKYGVFKRLLDAIEHSIEEAIKATPVTGQIESWLKEVADKVCGQMLAGLPLAPARCQLAVEPNVGTLRVGALDDPVGFYDCDPTQQVSSVELTVSRVVCGVSIEGKASLPCGGQEVEFTIGDNGSALDDIFELKVDGRTELTSSQPVRSISKKLFLTTGEHEVQMIGRAAPDNIGTYFLRIVGARVLSGPPLTGTDLTVNRVFTWKIQVDPK